MITTPSYECCLCYSSILAHVEMRFGILYCLAFREIVEIAFAESKFAGGIAHIVVSEGFACRKFVEPFPLFFMEEEGIGVLRGSQGRCVRDKRILLLAA